MADDSKGSIERLIQTLARLPGLGPRSARRAVLALLRRREQLLQPLIDALVAVRDGVCRCSTCGNLDTTDPCAVCRAESRDGSLICVVEDVGTLWAIERTRAYRGLYHVLGGTLSALEGIGPDDLSIDALVARAGTPPVREVVLALNATVDGQTTAHVIAERLAEAQAAVTVTRLAHGVPIGGELGYLDDGTLSAAMRARQALPRTS